MTAGVRILSVFLIIFMLTGFIVPTAAAMMMGGRWAWVWEAWA